jgi:hypothetical protein
MGGISNFLYQLIYILVLSSGDTSDLINPDADPSINRQSGEGTSPYVIEHSTRAIAHPSMLLNINATYCKLICKWNVTHVTS